jgi:DNA-binding PucR family transcriptional regulator
LEGDEQHLARVAVAVRAGSEVIGSLWAIAPETLDETAEQGFLAASRVAAVHLLRARAEQQVQRLARGELLRAVLEGRPLSDAQATRLGLDVAGRFTVVAVGLPAQAAADTLDAEAVADLVHLQCSALAPRTCVVSRPDHVLALVPTEGISRARLAELGIEVVRRTRVALGTSVRCGVGSAVTTIDHVPTSAAEAHAVLSLVVPEGVGLIEDLQPQVALLEWQALITRSPRLKLPLVERMLDHDRREHTSYAASILAYLAANGDINEAAGAVGVHANSFRYRMKRLAELFDFDLDDADTRLVLWLQLRSAQLRRTD